MENSIFTQRHAYTERVIATLKQGLESELGDQYDELIGEHTCVYATGSGGRGEMAPSSDLDAYVVRVDKGPLTNSGSIEQAVKNANDTARLPPLDGEGKYLKMAQASEILDLLGAPKDDESGVLTKRMLLLLESRVLVGAAAHENLVGQVIDAYWRNDTLHPHDYLPFVLVNDIVRYWRIVLLNHESRLRKKKFEIEQDSTIDPGDRKAMLLAERRYRSYKLRLPRCLTCFSALTYLLALTPMEPAHVSKENVREMVGLTPVERLRRLPELVGRELELVDELLEVYGSYLRVPRAKLLDQLRVDEDVQLEVSRAGGRFTKLMFELVQDLGGGRPLHRNMLV